MINEGFYKNINVKTPFTAIGNTICGIIKDCVTTEPSIRKYIPEAQVSIDAENILTVSSMRCPEISYKFDLKDAIKKIYDFIIDELKDKGVDIDYRDERIWNNLNITEKGCAYGVVTVKFHVTKGNITLTIAGEIYHGGIFFDIDLYKTLTGELEEYNQFTFQDCRFRDKIILTEPIKSNSISVCMDLRTYLTKAINGLHDGSLTSIQVKKNIEDYIKKL